jgi:hypothetical protein
MRTNRLLAVFAACSLAACDPIDRSPFGPGVFGAPKDTIDAPGAEVDPMIMSGLRQSQSQLLRHEGTVAFAQWTATMWAVRGESRSMHLDYGDGKRFATFTVGADALLSDAAGRPLAEGDSVQITMRVVNPAVFVVDMQPSGLRFNPASPAVLEFSLDRAKRSSLNARGLSFWKLESATSPWEPVDGAFDYERRTATARVPGFTLYVIAD